ncbi:MAG: hypothetical protein QOE77_4241 [Blastocatellia bacterium]|nr:hypothetical protein [Blastocatellia bacterium]
MSQPPAAGITVETMRRALEYAIPASRSLYATSLGSIALCIALWIRAKTIGEDERANAERRALFVGLWPPMFWLIGDTVRRADRRSSRFTRLRGI